VLEEARARFPDLLIVSVSASADQLHLRLANRGRESPEEIERRVARALAFAVEGTDVVEVRNDGAPEVAVQALLRLL
jgi:ribose 1,5-bisphosphokinase